MINLRRTRSYRLASIYLLAALFFFPSFSLGIAADPAAQATQTVSSPPAVMIERSTDDTSTTYSISQQGCRIEWIARNAEVGVVKLWSQCALPLSEQMPLITRIYTEFLRTYKNARALHLLFVGEIDPDTETGPRDMSIRLALAAHKSSGWDARRGEARIGDINGFVKDLANREMIYPELQELFGRFHQSIKVSCVEKVLVQQADKLPYFNQLKKRGVKASDKLPFDCMTWFTIATQ